MNLKRIITQLQNNRKGYAWYLGSFIIIAMLSLSILFIKKWQIDLALETIEDMTTASALGAMDINVQQYALFRDTVFSSDPASNDTTNFSDEGIVSSPDRCYETLKNLIAANLHLTHDPDTCFYTGKSSIIDTETNPLILKKVIFYNYYVSDDYVESYTYEAGDPSGFTVYYKPNETIFPTEATMDNSGIYLEVEIPIEFLGYHTSITKAQWVAAKFN